MASECSQGGCSKLSRQRAEGRHKRVQWLPVAAHASQPLHPCACIIQPAAVCSSVCRPLVLHAERLRHLAQLWRSSALDYDSHVLHVANHRNEPASVY